MSLKSIYVCITIIMYINTILLGLQKYNSSTIRL